MMKEAITLDEIRRFRLMVGQPVNGYRFSLDALLLAEFVNCPDFSRIADLGTGCGVIPMILCRRFSGTEAVGIENNSTMAALAQENVERNGLIDQIQTISCDITEIKSLYPVSSFDGIVSNPPFRAQGTGRISPKSGRDTARHEATAGIADFLATAKYLVKPSGRIWFVYHPDRFAEFIQCATQLKLSLLRLQMVHSSHDSPAKIFLAELVKGRKGELRIEAPIILQKDCAGRI